MRTALALYKPHGEEQDSREGVLSQKISEALCMEPGVQSDPHNHASAGRPTSPFRRETDLHLRNFTSHLTELYNQGKRSFVIVTHRDPDADSMAGCLGLDILIRSTLADKVQVRWMHDGALSDPLRDACGRGTESIANLECLLEDPSVAIFVVDQPELNRCTVLPEVMRGNPVLATRKADGVLDHHCQEAFEPGVVVFPLAGSTASLVWRALELRGEDSLFPVSHTFRDDMWRLAFLANMGARTDAGMPVLGELSHCASPYVKWVVGETQWAVAPAQADRFDILKSQGGKPLSIAHATRQTFEGANFEGVEARVILAHAGVVDSKHCIGACASALFQEESADLQRPVVVVVFGIIDPGCNGCVPEHAARETIQSSIRTSQGISAEKIAQKLAHDGGGGPAAAAFQMHRPQVLAAVRDDQFLKYCLDFAGFILRSKQPFSLKLSSK